jgi:uncharacterized protein (DUF1800 family)
VLPPLAKLERKESGGQGFHPLTTPPWNLPPEGIDTMTYCIVHPSRHRPTRSPLLAPATIATAAFALVTLWVLLGASSLLADPLAMPWRAAGLSEREAAAHLLDRLAFGARPGEVDRVVEQGLEAWVEQQLAAALPEPVLEGKLRRLKTLEMSPRQIADTYPNPGLVLMQAARAGVIDREGLQRGTQPGPPQENPPQDRNPERRKVMEWARQQGYRPQREVLQELAAWKVLSARYAENQLRQVMADFWSNHFYISRADNEVRSFLLSYERDAVRPHILGDFPTLLAATARHPAMLLYLDNARSTASEAAQKTFDRERFERRQRGGRGGFRGRGADSQRNPEGERRRSTGLNENYARELLELHTLGVEGGYTQEDVVAVARAFTGWTVIPPGEGRQRVEGMLRRNPQATRLGFVADLDGLFLFRADAHDAGPKTVLGRSFPEGRGIEDGQDVLGLVARHPSTATHLARKLAVRFVSDQPPEALVQRLAATFTATDGDIPAVLRTLVQSPEFWSPTESRGQKIKSPFELILSALRATGAEVLDARGVIQALERLGQPLWGYQAPTGYPDRADFWVNTGALLGRMNFGLALAMGRLPGVRLDVTALLEGREPESAEEALAACLPLLLPERDPEPTLRRLRPLVRDPRLAEKVDAKAPALEEPSPMTDPAMEAMLFPGLEPESRGDAGWRLAEKEPTALAQVVGVILGSPEFQRR